MKIHLVCFGLAICQVASFILSSNTYHCTSKRNIISAPRFAEADPWRGDVASNSRGTIQGCSAEQVGDSATDWIITIDGWVSQSTKLGVIYMYPYDRDWSSSHIVVFSFHVYVGTRQILEGSAKAFIRRLQRMLNSSAFKDFDLAQYRPIWNRPTVALPWTNAHVKPC